MKTYILLCTTVTLLSFASFAQATCYDVSNKEPSALSGHLTHRMFAGPPNFEDVQKGDTPEPGYILKLDQPICITGDEFADADTMFDEVQLIPTEKTAKDMAALRDTYVFVDVKDPMPAMTGHHHRPLLAWVTEISSARDITTSYGTAATTIEAFYAALHSGDGKLATNFIVPEKTKKGPFSATAMTKFCSSLAEPITLIDVHPIDDNRFAVRYRFRSRSQACNGAATIIMVKRNERDFILSIHAENGC